MARRIKNVEVTGFRRIREARFTPAEHRVDIVGPNGSGKSSVLDAIEAALGNYRAAGPDVVHAGDTKATVTLHIGDEDVEAVVTQTWEPDRKEAGKFVRRLSVRTIGWHPTGTPAEILKSITGGRQFNAEDFLNAPEEKRLATLRTFIPGFDFGEAERNRAALFAERTEAGREVRHLEGAVAERQSVIPADIISTRKIEVVVAELKLAEEANADADRHDNKRANILSRIEYADAAARSADNNIRSLEQELLNAKAQLLKHHKEATELRVEAAEMLRYRPLRIDTRPLQSEMERARILIKAQMQSDELAQAKAKLDRAKRYHADIDQRLADGDKAMRDAIAAAEFPVPGLSVTATSVLLNGHPFETASTRERLHVAVALFIAANPSLRVLILREGDKFDAAGRALLDELAERHDFQIIAERVAETDGETDGGSVVIYDGAVLRQDKGRTK